MSLRNTPVPERGLFAKLSLFDQVVSAQERHVIQANAPKPLHLYNDRSEDGSWDVADVKALMNVGRKRGYRIQSRATESGGPKRRNVWISWDPKRGD